MPLVDLDLLRSIYDAHNEAGVEFPDLLARDFLDEDVEFVECPEMLRSRSRSTSGMQPSIPGCS